MRLGFVLLGLLSIGGLSMGQDLASVERTIAKEPSYETAAPKYALLVFGEKLTTKVWLVLDGDVLYADLNGNGDLTESSEKIAKTDLGNKLVIDGTLHFDVKEIREGELTHRGFYLTVQPAKRLPAPVLEFRRLIEKEASAVAYRIGGQLQMADARGTGVDGRKKVLAWSDAQGALQFANKAEDAPVIHLGGKPKLALSGEHELVIGRAKDISLGIGAKGLGAGSTAWIESNEIPKGIPLLVEAAFSSSSSEASAPLQVNASVADRYSTFYMLGEILTPETATPGVATVQVRLAESNRAKTEPETFSIKVVEPRTEVKLALVTKRLVKQLIFGHREAIVGQLKFSPDGSRLFGVDYPGGLFTVWDVKTGEALVEVETGAGLRGSGDFGHVTPNWKTLYIWFDPARRIKQIEIDGNPGIQASYGGALRGWSLETGEEIALMQHDPPHGGDHSVAAPDASWITTHEDIPGDYTRAAWGQHGYRTSIWDLASQSSRPIGGPGEFPILASADNRFLAMWSNDRRSFQWYDILTAEPLWKYDGGEGFQAVPTCSTSDGKGLIVAVAKRDPKTFAYLGSWLKVIDLENGTEKSSFEVDAKLGSGARQIANQLNRNLLEIVRYEFANSTLRRIDSRLMEEKDGKFQELVRVEFPSGNAQMTPNISRMALSPNGELAALLVAGYPIGGNQDPSRVDPLPFPQPQLWIIDVSAGKVIEKCDLPQGLPNCVAFSPDGKTIAATGNGRVNLIDVADLVGAKSHK